MPISRTTALRCGAVVTASAASSAGSSAFAAKAVVHPTVEDFSAIVAAYRELQIGLNRRSAERDRAVAAINEVADGYHAAMNVGADDQLWAADRPGEHLLPEDVLPVAHDRRLLDDPGFRASGDRAAGSLTLG